MSLEKEKLTKLKELFPQSSDLELLTAILENTEERKYRKKIIGNIKDRNLKNYIDSKGQTIDDRNRKDFENKTEAEIDFIESIEEISANFCRNKKVLRRNEANERILNENDKYSLFKFNAHIPCNKIEQKNNKNLIIDAIECRNKAYEKRNENNETFNKQPNINNKRTDWIIEAFMQQIDFNNSCIKEFDKKAINNLIKNNEILNQKNPFKDILIIDLHNFHLNEAINYAKDILFGIKLRIKGLKELSEDKRNRKFRYKKIEFITGRSTKSYKIRPALINLLESEGYTYFENGPKILVNLF